MPRGSRYTWELSPSSEEKRQERLLFEFILYLTETKTGPLPKKALTPVFTTTPVSFSHRVVSLGNRHFLLYRSLFRSLLEKHSRFPSSPLELDHAISEIFYQLGEHSRNKISPSPDFLLIEKGISYLENDTCFEKSICQLAKESNVSVRYFEKLFKRYAGVSPKEYADARRIYWIKILLGQQGIPLKEIAHRLSFADSAYLCRFFKNKTGMTPSEYRSRYC